MPYMTKPKAKTNLPGDQMGVLCRPPVFSLGPKKISYFKNFKKSGVIDEQM